MSDMRKDFEAWFAGEYWANEKCQRFYRLAMVYSLMLAAYRAGRSNALTNYIDAHGNDCGKVSGPFHTVEDFMNALNTPDDAAIPDQEQKE